MTSALEAIRGMRVLALEDVTEDVESVYFIESGGLVKVGWSKRPRNRLIGLINSSGVPPRILAVADGTRAREQHIHSLLEKSRHHSEWFHPTEELVGWIREALSDSPTWRALPNGDEHQALSGPVVLTEKQKKQREILKEMIRELELAEEAAERTRVEFLLARGRDAQGNPIDFDAHVRALRSAS